MATKTLLALLLLSVAPFVQAQTNPTVSNDVQLPTGSPCAAGYSPGTEETLVTIPYTYPQVMSIVGNYTNLTWAGSPDNSVLTNASASTLMTNAWKAGDARFYVVQNISLVETIIRYSRPAAKGPYNEDHTLGVTTFPLGMGATLKLYADFDGQIWEEACGGKAVRANFTAKFCATNVTLATGLLHMAHEQSALEVAKFLGGKNFTSCDALMASGSGNASASGNGSSTASGGGKPNAGAKNFGHGVLETVGFAILVSAVMVMF